MKGAKVFMPLTKNRVTVIDFEDYEKVKQNKWHYRDTGYAVSHTKQPAAIRKRLRMHRVIMNCPKNKEVDHIDGNGLNNRRSNLRICTRSQNMMNKGKPGKGSSLFKGVSWHKAAGKYRSRIKINKKEIHLGLFNSAEEAHLAYQRAATKYHKQFANFGGSL